MRFAFGDNFATRMSTGFNVAPNTDDAALVQGAQEEGVRDVGKVAGDFFRSECVVESFDLNYSKWIEVCSSLPSPAFSLTRWRFEVKREGHKRPPTRTLLVRETQLAAIGAGDRRQQQRSSEHAVHPHHRL